MPELPEIRRYSEQINAWASGKTFTHVTISGKPKGPPIGATNFRLSAQARGKELLIKISGPTDLSICFNHGLVRRFTSNLSFNSNLRKTNT